MKALVTGGAGFIGSNLVGALLARGAQVTVLDNVSSGYALNLRPHPGVRFVQGDVRDSRAVEEAIRGSNTVFHLAASVGGQRSFAHPHEDATTNLPGTLNVLEASRLHGVRKLVFASSASVYGEMQSLPIREEHPCEPTTPYGASKLGGEKLCLSYAKAYGLETICLRYFDVYGPGQRFDALGKAIPALISAMLRGEAFTVYGNGEQSRDFVHVRDVVQATLRAALAPHPYGAFNVGSGTRTTVNELIKEAGVSNAVYSKPRVGEVRHRLADISAARRAFGFIPRIPLIEGLAEYIAWAKLDLQAVATR